MVFSFNGFERRRSLILKMIGNRLLLNVEKQEGTVASGVEMLV
jgi:hypothetical protein